MSEPKRKMIIDTDTGGDDALAILMAARCPDVEILGVTVAAGNVPLPQALKNALMSLEVAGCDAPVFPGAEASLSGAKTECFSVYGTDGMGDKDLIHPTRTAEEKSAVDFLLDTIRAYPDEVEIVALAPVTNIALAIQKEPETMKHVKKIWSMASAGLGPGNATPVAEFNVYKDAEAYDVLLRSGIPVTVIGLDLCEEEETLISAEELSEMEKGSALQKFAALAFSKLLDFRREGNGQNNVDACDAIAMAHALDFTFTTKALLCNASCITLPCEAYGQVIFYRSDRAYDSMPKLSEPKITLLNGQESGRFKKYMNELLA